jgi:hypothetical protein
MASEASLVLQAIRDELANHPPDVVGALTLNEDLLSASSDKLRLTAFVHHDPGAHPSLAHVHVVAEIGFGSQAARLEACVIGIHSDRHEALAHSGRSWVAAVAGPIFSLLHAKPVLDAAHFNGSEPWGIAGCHGFVGPLTARFFEREPDLAPLEDAIVFDYADALAPAGVVHLAKVTLNATGEGWSRNIEIDGHEAVHSDANWNTGLPRTSQGVLSQFAVFHYGDRPRAIEQRQRVDAAIRQFVTAFQETGDTDKAADLLVARGIDAALVHDASCFVPVALGRVIFGSIGAKFSPDFVRISRDASTQTLRLMRQPVYARTTVLASELLSGQLMNAAKSLALTSAEINAINSALHAGSNPQDLSLLPPLMPDPDVGQTAMEEAMRQMQNSAHRAPPSSKPSKPWWRMW